MATLRMCRKSSEAWVYVIRNSNILAYTLVYYNEYYTHFVW